MSVLYSRRRTISTVAIFLCLLPAASRAAVHCDKPIADGSMACSIDPTLDPAALCNDGTVPAFWVRPGHGTGATSWLIWLQGGGDCNTTATCVARAQTPGMKRLLTSSGFAAAAGQGVLSAEPAINPILYNANTVLVHYCSSDNWSGNYSATQRFNPADPASWNFQGRRIALATVASLSELGTGFANATRIVLGGSSAGGLGITLIANDLLPALPKASTIVLVNDAGFSLDIGQYDPDAPPPYIFHGHPNAFDMHFEEGMALWKGRGDAKCDAAAHTKWEHIGCYNASYVLQQGYIAAPSFVAESQLDTAQIRDELCATLHTHCAISHNPDSTEGQYAIGFGASMAKTLIGSGTQSSYFVYSPDTLLHVMLSNRAFVSQYAFPGGSLSPQEVFDAWLRAPEGARKVHIGNAPGL